MPKIRHRKRVRTARLSSTSIPLGGGNDQSNGASTSSTTSTTNSNGDGLMGPPAIPTNTSGVSGEGKKVGKKESEVTNLLEKLSSDKVEERVWASSALSSLLLTLPEVTLRLLLSKNLIGLLIERLSDEDDEVVVECLGSLRNLAVSSPPSILSEMHNKKLLIPLTTTHLPLLLSLLPTLLLPPPAPLTAPLPSTPTQRLAIEFQNNRIEKRRRLYWDWSENLFYLIWCLAESNVKILGSLNAPGVGEGLVGFLSSYLESEALGITSVGGGEEADGMDIEEGTKKGGKKASKKGKTVEKRERVPLFCAVAAAQTLQAFISSNPPALSHLISHPTALLSLSSILQNSTIPTPPTRTDNHLSTLQTDTEDYSTLQVVTFGILLEVSKNCKKLEGEGVRESVRGLLKGSEGVLMGLLGSDLEGVAKAAVETARDVPSTTSPGDPLTPHLLTLASYEKKLSTLQLSLETLSEWCSTLEIDSLYGGISGENEEEDEEEEWGGIPGQDDVEMDEDDDESNEDDNEEVILGVGATMDQSGGEGGDMEDDKIDLGSDSSQDEEEESGKEVVVGGVIKIFLELPGLLINLAKPTSLSFLSPSPPLPSTTSTTSTSHSNSNPNNTPVLIPTSKSTSQPSHPSLSSSSSSLQEVPSPYLNLISDHLSTIHVRSMECLNNLYITLSRTLEALESNPKSKSKGSKGLDLMKVGREIQRIWEEVFNLLQSRLQILESISSSTSSSIANGGKKEKEEEMGEDRSMELIMAGVGTIWGMSRIGLGKSGSLIVGEATTPFLIQIFIHPYATAPTPSGESIQVRIIGSLGYIGRRTTISLAENESIGLFLLSLLPVGKATGTHTTATTTAATPEVLVQAIDSLIDLYSDEDSSYDIEVFRKKSFLTRLESSVSGVRAAAKKIDRKKFPELRSRADGALENLVAFVEYRKGI